MTRSDRASPAPRCLASTAGPGANRVLLRCEHAEDCAGCTALDEAYGTQLEHKRERVLRAFAHYPALADIVFAEVSGAAVTDSYRTRAKLVVASDRGVANLGLFARDGSHRVVDIPNCRVTSPTLGRAAAALRALLRAPPETLRPWLAHRRGRVSPCGRFARSGPGRFARGRAANAGVRPVRRRLAACRPRDSRPKSRLPFRRSQRSPSRGIPVAARRSWAECRPWCTAKPSVRDGATARVHVHAPCRARSCKRIERRLRTYMIGSPNCLPTDARAP